MNYYEILEEIAKEGYEEFINFLDSDSNLLYNEEKTELGEIDIEVGIFDDDEGTDFLGRYSFDEYGNYVI